MYGSYALLVPIDLLVQVAESRSALYKPIQKPDYAGVGQYRRVPSVVDLTLNVVGYE